MARGMCESKKSNLRGLSEEQYKKKELNKDERFKKFDVLEEVEEGGGGRERITTKDVKDYSISKDLKKHIDKFHDKIE
jgi:hypothetical protein